MSNISLFNNWYVKYLETCNKSYDKTIESDCRRTKEITEKLSELIQIRTSQTDMCQLHPLDNKIKELEIEIEESSKRIDRVDQIKEKMEKSLKMNSSKIIRKRILAHPFIKKIIATETSLSIITKKLYANKKYIGYYQIKIQSNGMHCSAGNTKIKNLEYVVENRYDHWHVENNNPCLAAWRDILQRHLDTYQLFLFFDTFIHYLTLSDSTHAYIDFKKWFEKFTKRGKKQKKTKKQIEEEINEASARIEEELQKREHRDSNDLSAQLSGSMGWSTNTTTSTDINWGTWI